MFSNTRQGSRLYILHKDKIPTLDIGEVISVSNTYPKYQNNIYNQYQEMVVDISVKVDGNIITYQKLPANFDIADFGAEGNIVVSCDIQAINNEVTNLKNKALEVLNSIEYNKSLLVGYSDILKKINPEFAHQQRQEEENKVLRKEVAELKEMLSNFIANKNTKKDDNN